MFRPCCLILFIAGMFVNLGYAQSNFGRISGTVADSSGTSIAGATVTANNTGTGGKQSVKSDSSGNFAFPPLEAGTYTVAVEQQGFKTSQQTGLVLDAASTRSLTFQMVLGTVTESVEVAAAVQQVDTTSGSVGSVITGQQVSQIALNGREYIQLLRLAPGTVSTTLNVFNPQLATNQQAINRRAIRLNLLQANRLRQLRDHGRQIVFSVPRRRADLYAPELQGKSFAGVRRTLLSTDVTAETRRESGVYLGFRASD